MGPYEFRERVERHTKEATKKLQDIKEIGILKEQCSEINFVLEIHQREFNELKRAKQEELEEYHESYWPYKLSDYEKEIEKLKELQKELLEKSSKDREQKQKEQRS